MAHAIPEPAGDIVRVVTEAAEVAVRAVDAAAYDSAIAQLARHPAADGLGGRDRPDHYGRTEPIEVIGTAAATEDCSAFGRSQMANYQVDGRMGSIRWVAANTYRAVGSNSRLRN